MLAAALFGALSAAIVFALFWFVLYPIVQGMMGLRYLRKKYLQEAKEQLKLHLVKSALCKTQAVTGPEITRCKGCGATLLLLEGKQCQYFGSHIPMFEHDWVIVGYGG